MLSIAQSKCGEVEGQKQEEKFKGVSARVSGLGTVRQCCSNRNYAQRDGLESDYKGCEVLTVRWRRIASLRASGVRCWCRRRVQPAKKRPRHGACQSTPLALELPGGAVQGRAQNARSTAKYARLPFRPIGVLQIGSSTIKSECKRASLRARLLREHV